MEFGKKPRKNTRLVLSVVTLLFRKGENWADSSKIYDYIKQHGLDNFWDRDPKRVDDHGIKKSIGDIIGGKQQLLKLDSDGIGWELCDNCLTREYLESKDIDYDQVMAQSVGTIDLDDVLCSPGVNHYIMVAEY